MLCIASCAVPVNGSALPAAGALLMWRNNVMLYAVWQGCVLLVVCFICRLDTQLTSLQSGNTGSSAAANPAGADVGSDPWQQQATDSLANLHLLDEYDHEHDHEDYHEHDDYEYDSADDDDWHKGLSRTPGRRPTQRHVVKHERSNSVGNGGGGGSQQQRQQQQGQQRPQLAPQQRGPIPRWRQGVGQGQGRQRGGGNGPTGL